MKPDLIQFSVGKTVWDQPVKLRHERNYDGKVFWTLTQEAAGQRDESSTIRGLTDETILAMAEAIKQTR